MNKQQLDAWINDEKNAQSEYLEIAQQIYNSRFSGTTSGGSESDTQKKVKEQLELQTQQYQQQQLELKKIYLAGNDEKLQTESQFNRAMEELTLQDLNKRLQIIGLEADQRQQIEDKILDIRIKAMEDFYVKKSEIEQQQEEERQQKNQQAMEDNDKWMKQQMTNLQATHEERTKIIQESLQKQVDSYKDYGTQIGTSLGQVLSGQENMLAAFGNTMVDILFNVLEQIINQKIAEATAVAVAEEAKAAAISAAQPDSVVTFGATAGARTAIISGLIMAALASAKTALKGLLS